MTEPTAQICILGGGFAGLYTALRLGQLPWDDISQPVITLVDQGDRFVFTPLLYELLTGELQSWEIAPPFSELLKETSIHFIQATVQEIQTKTATVQLNSQQTNLQETLNYDRLVIALGGETAVSNIPGMGEYGYQFRTLADAYRLDERLRELEVSDQDKIRISLVGAGPSGVELACKLAERLGKRGRVRLIDRNREILKSSPKFNQETAQKALEERGVWVDLETTPIAMGPNSLTLRYKGDVTEIPVDLVLWTIGTQVAAPIQNLDLAKNDQGRLITTPTLQVPDHDQIFALGDAAYICDREGQQIPQTAQAAFQQADYAAWNIWASLNQRPLLPFSYSHLGEMLTLGSDAAALAGLGLTLDGPLAYLARRLAYLYRMPTLDHQLKVGLNWVFRPLIEQLTR
ncbi:NAD(P)/FAD-dependent oxidoreductase [Candidatus Synechococcus calcipolaris G9]|uniref:NAD(P)/FAD-dependent oxidoreductase n=1 Tax=Candidatus Synechococcus calcipolaris G9 TaxID=1497997 RepID=A0ABT6F101_9SYNE|nr:NAD(P)/FAD-dependent oxidoreductase [Candidatus Synechococcus calcipolaris]MDG2991527.1 NAD(P)/FAD-dependent oxidoreductase [Candidatus Synechococcus calcipolaris G9]